MTFVELNVMVRKKSVVWTGQEKKDLPLPLVISGRTGVGVISHSMWMGGSSHFI